MLPFGVLFIIVFIIGFMFAASYLAASRKQRDKSPRPIPTIDWDAIDDEALQAALARGSKIDAIKIYREHTGQGLKDSKDAIEHAMLHPEARGDKKKKATYDSQDAGIRDLVKDGRIDEAVEVYQKFAGVDLYTAKDAIAEIEHDLLNEEITSSPNQQRHT